MVRKVNPYLILFILILVILLGIFLIFFKIDKYRQEFYSSFIASDNSIGFDLNNTAITFGIVKIGGSSTRNIVLENTFDRDVRIIINSEGEISNYLSISENDFKLAPKETKNISFYVNVPLNTTLKKYEGKIIISRYL